MNISVYQHAASHFSGRFFKEDSFPPQSNGIGDICECESDFDCDGDVDGTDATTFKLYFGRNLVFYPCDEVNPCRGDFDCDQDCDGTDALLFKSDFLNSIFSRSMLGNPEIIFTTISSAYE